MALSWDDTLPAGGQATYSYLAGFSPSGEIPPNPLTPEPPTPDLPPPGTPEEPDPAPAPRPPSQESTITVPGPVVAGPNGGVASIGVTCRAIGSDRPRACIIETRSGNRRRVFVLGPGDVARLNLRLTDAQRARLQRDCETIANFRAVVYQPPGQRARVVRAHRAGGVRSAAPAGLPRPGGERVHRPTGCAVGDTASSPRPGARARRLLTPPGPIRTTKAARASGRPSRPCRGADARDYLIAS